MSKSKSSNEQPKNEREFFEKLLKLCQEYKVNMQTDNLAFWDSKNKTEGVYAWVEVCGGWNICAEYDALTAHRLETPAVETIHSIKGTK